MEEEPQPEIHSKAKDLINYSFLVVFANDDTISEGELKLIEKFALKDGVVDDDEKKVIQTLFKRANRDHMTAEVKAEFERFCTQYGL